jgi:hypothetical protein
LRSVWLDRLRGWLIGLWLREGDTRDANGAEAHASGEDAASVIRLMPHLALQRSCSISMVRWLRKHMGEARTGVGPRAIVVVRLGCASRS